MQASHAIGVDLGGTKILAGVVDRDGSIVRRHERATPQDSQEHVLAEIEAAVAELMDDSVGAVGFGVPSPIDQARGVVVRCVNVPLEDAPLRDRMHERFGLPVGLDNDANAAAHGEWRAGAGRGKDDVVMLTLGTGVGGGVVSGGRPFRGRNGAGAELGHVVIVHDGRPCQGACTGRGHLETYASGSAATAAAREAFGPSADAHRLVRLANEGDAHAKELLEDVARHLGSGIGSFVNIFGPQLVILGGGFGVAAYDYLRGPAEEVMRREALEPMRSAVRLAKAELGTAAGLIGAGFVGFEALDAAGS
ncbi:MAG TPA: ROK family protein [Gaiellaceae bacterium]|nr:ROK family protein [Gaiellaceae bacterium]